MTIKAILFDLDNTLTHRDQSIQAYSRHVLRHFTPDLVESDNQSYDKTVALIRRIDNGGYPKKEHLTHPSIAASVGHAMLQELEWSHPPSLEVLTQFWFEQFGLSAVAMQGAKPLLQQLKAQQYRLAVISNGGHATRLKIIEGLGFHHYFDEIFSSESVGIAKPKAEIFQHACDHLGVAPKQSLYVGDHPVNDYQGARQAGLKALLLTGFHHGFELEVDPKHQIQQLDQISQYL